MRVSWPCLASSTLAALALAACSGGTRPVAEADLAVVPPDLAISFADDGGPTVLPDGAVLCGNGGVCEAGQRCLGDVCIPDNGVCNTYDDCENDTACVCTGGGGTPDGGDCMGGVCIRFGADPAPQFDDTNCSLPGFTPDKFAAPKLTCQRPGTTTLSTTLVADLDGDGKPEIIYPSYPNGFTALHGKDCSVYFDIPFTFGDSGQSQLAVADLDGDHKPEIIGVDASQRVVVFDNKGMMLASAQNPSATAVRWGGPIVVDVDNKAPPEIVVAGQAVRYRKGMNTLDELWNVSVPASTFGVLSIAADLDGDNKPEIITGNRVLDGLTGKDKTPPDLAAVSPGYDAIGDFNRDGKPDIVVVMPDNPGQAAIYDYAHTKWLFGPVALPGNWGGPPTVADFDGDGQPEFATAGADNFFVIKPSCMVKNGKPPPKCDQSSNVGILWQKATQDHSSGVTGSSVFDFNGDGAAEVVYRDECWLRVYDGKTGRTLFAAAVSSATAFELPVIADVDNDGHADIAVSADKVRMSCPGTPEVDTMTPWAGQTDGVLVFRDPKNRWMPSRPLWNEHSYHITNVNDDLTVPTVEKPGWVAFNNYRQNVQGVGGQRAMDVPDYTAAPSMAIEQGNPDCMNSWTLRAQICNRGAGTANAGLVGAFYMEDPRSGSPAPICVAGPTQGALDPGTCEEVSCTWQSPPSGAVDLWFRAPDDGKGGAALPECHPGNDLLILPRAKCNKIG